MQIERLTKILEVGTWELIWKGDLKWNDTTIESSYLFKNIDNQVEKNIFLPLDYFSIFPIGLRFDIIGNIKGANKIKKIVQNSTSDRIIKTIQINKPNEKNFDSWNYTGIVSVIKNGFSVNWTENKSFLYSKFFKIYQGNTTILIPRAEITRFLYFTGNIVINHFINDSLSANQFDLNYIDELYKIEQRGLVDEKNNKTYSIIKLNSTLSLSEKKTIIRIAYFKKAFTEAISIYLELQKFESLTNKEPNKKDRFYKFNQDWYQEKPFNLKVCGENIKIDNKNYFLVYEIYACEEHFPFDEIVEIPLIDKSPDSIQGNSSELQSTNGVRKYNLSSSNTTLHDRERNTSLGKTNIEFLSENPYSDFFSFPKFTEIKNKEQLVHYESSEKVYQTLEILTTNFDTSSESDAGYVNIKKGTKGKNTSNIKDKNKTIQLPVFKDAINNLKVTYQVHFLNFVKSTWEENYYVNKPKNKSEYIVIQICNPNNQQYFYIFRFVTPEHDNTRFGFFYQVTNKQMDVVKVKDISMIICKKNRMCSELEIMPDIQRLNIRYFRHNQSGFNLKDLTDRLFNLLITKLH